MDKKWTIIVGLVLIAVVVGLLWYFAPVIQQGVEKAILYIIILLATFAAGWLLGRFGGKKPQDPDKKNARNITEAQK